MKQEMLKKVLSKITRTLTPQYGDFTIIDVIDNVVIGSEVAIGPNCAIYTQDHIYSNTDVPSWKGDLKFKEVVIENGA
ncbi:MAG: hypothetical protein V7719_02340 [Psychroserpens sp.]|uniref:hypothetical protein n=1 Tax=Psychroserpens sp. TaxID=2020870 RepID=UPI0030030DD8